jgi:hypothetical protein
MHKPYNQETEGLIQLYYLRLPEKEKRHYAALDARKLGYGGKQYIGRLLKISQKTLRKAERELTQVELYAQIPEGKQRRAGGGRKKFCLSP